MFIIQVLAPNQREDGGEKHWRYINRCKLMRAETLTLDLHGLGLENVRIESSQKRNPNAWVRGSIRANRAKPETGEIDSHSGKKSKGATTDHSTAARSPKWVDARAGEEPAAPPSVTTEHQKCGSHNFLDLARCGGGR
jgi:hypothetical protein